MSRKNKEKKEKVVYTLDPFVEWAHRTGRVFILCFIAYTIVIPVIISIVYDAWPTLSEILPGVVTLLAMLGVQCILEEGIYCPILGSSTYLTAATGNVMNLKIPCALNAQEVAGVETNTTAGDAIALISTAVSSIVTIIVLFIGVLLVIPLKPLLESEITSSASNYLLAALFGCIAVGFIFPMGGSTEIKNKLLIAVPPFVITMVLALAGILSPAMGIVMILASIPICIITGRILYKKGIVRVEHNETPAAAEEATQAAEAPAEEAPVTE